MPLQGIYSRVTTSINMVGLVLSIITTDPMIWEAHTWLLQFLQAHDDEAPDAR